MMVNTQLQFDTAPNYRRQQEDLGSDQLTDSAASWKNSNDRERKSVGFVDPPIDKAAGWKKGGGRERKSVGFVRNASAS